MSKNSNPKNFAEGDRGPLYLRIIVTLVVNYLTVDYLVVDFSVGDIRSQIAAEWLQIARRSQWRAYRKLPSLFLMVPSMTPYDLHFPPKLGFHIPQHTRMAISLQRVIRSTSCLVLGWGFRDGRSKGAIYGSNKSKMAATAMLEKFQVPISPQRVVRSTSCFCSRWGFRGRRI